MVERIQTHYRKKRTWYLTPLAIVLLASLVIFGGKALSFGEQDRIIFPSVDSKDGWNMNTGFDKDWYSNKDNVSFVVDLSVDLKEWQMNHQGEMPPDVRPFEVTAKQGDKVIGGGTFNYTQLKNPDFTGRYLVEIPGAAEGQVEITVAINEENSWDIASSSAEFFITKDKTAPDVKLSTDQDRNEDVTLTVEIAEANFSKDAVEVSVKERYSSQPVTVYPEWGQNGTGYIGTHQFTTSGEYEVTVKAADKASNQAEVKTTSFVIDKKNAEFQVTDTDHQAKIENTGFSRSKNVQFKVINGISINTAYVLVKKVGEDKPTEVPLTINGKEATSDYSFAGDGNYSVEAVVSGRNGKQQTLGPLMFEVDSTVPVVNVTDGDGKPLQEKYNSGQTINIHIADQNFDRQKSSVSGTRTDSRGNKVSLNNQLFIDDKGKAMLDAAEDGLYELEIKARDRAGNETTHKTSFTIDQSVPEISHNIEKKYYKSVELRLSVFDYTLNPSQTTLKVNRTFNGVSEDYTAKLGGPTLDIWHAAWTYKFTEDGDYDVTVTSTDVFNHPNEKKFSFTVDGTIPVLSVTNVENKLYPEDVKGVGITVTDQTLDPEKISLVIKKDEEPYAVAPLKVNGETASNQYNFTEDGNYTIELGATDKADNNAQIQPISFTVDGNKPELLIANIENGGHYQELKDIEIWAADVTLRNATLEIKRDGETISSEELKVVKDKRLNKALKNVDFTVEGDYEIILTATDSTDRVSEKKLTFTIDATKPDIGVSGIDNGAFVKNGTLNIAVKEHNFTDNQVDITVLRKIGRGDQPEAYTEIGEWKNTGELSTLQHLFNQDGDYQISVKAKDKAGNEASADWQFTIDNAKPVITISNSGDNGSYYNETTNKAITVSVNERNYENNQVSIEATRKLEADSQKEPISFGSWNNTGEQSSLSQFFSEDGEYEITVQAVDEAGNAAEAQTVKFTVDKVTPELSISGVSDDEHYRTDMPVEFKLTDRNIDLGATTLSVTRDGEAYTKVGELSQTGTAAARAFNFSEEGTYVVNFKTKDLAGNEKVLPALTFVIDKTKPVLGINGVEDQSFNSNAKRGVTVSVDERYFSTNNVDLTATKDGKRFNIGEWVNRAKLSTLAYDFVEDGYYTIHIGATDKAGNGPVTAAKSFTIDKVKPAIEITGVDNGEHYNVDKRVTATIKDVNLDVNKVTVTKIGAAYRVGGFAIEQNTYSDSVAALSHNFSEEGEYVMTVEATDKAGNSFSRQMSFTIDKTKPVITPKMKGDGRTLIDGEFINKVFTPMFVLDEAEDSIVSVSLNGGPNVLGQIPTASKEMVYNYKVVARDKAGNESVLEISFTLDTTKPFLEINGILDGFFNKDISPKVEYRDDHLDTARTSVTLNGQPFKNGIKLDKETDYVLKAMIYDKANNLSSRTIVFTIDKSKPVIKFKEPISNKYFNKNIIPEMLIEDMSAYDIISLTLDGEPYELGSPVKKEGKHVLFFEVKDKAGNIQQLSVEFIIDKTKPKVIYEGVKEGGKYYDPVTVKMHLDHPADMLKEITVNGELFDGTTVEENGQPVIKATFNEKKTYKVKVTAYDEAGNETASELSFEIAEKSMLVQLYENKPLFAGTIGGVIALIGAGAAGLVMMARRKKAQAVE
jgi:large repetitive protein